MCYLSAVPLSGEEPLLEARRGDLVVVQEDLLEAVVRMTSFGLFPNS
jgi:hypothetical protein